MDTLYRHPCRRFHRTMLAGRCPWCGRGQLGAGPHFPVLIPQTVPTASLHWAIPPARRIGPRPTVVPFVLNLLFIPPVCLVAIFALIGRDRVLAFSALLLLALQASVVVPWVVRPRRRGVPRQLRSVRT